MDHTNFKIFANFEKSPFSLLQRGIEVDDFTKAIGLVALAFSDLENELSNLAQKLLKIDSLKSEIITSEMSFKNQVFMVSSLMRSQEEILRKNVSSENLELFIDEFTKMLFKCEELRNQLLHSVYVRYSDKGATRVKVTAKSKGHNRKEEQIETSTVLDVYDFIVSSKMYIEDVIVD